MLVNYFASDVPMGGWKDSGIGFRHGEPGIKKFCRSESLVITRFAGKREPTWLPLHQGAAAACSAHLPLSAPATEAPAGHVAADASR